ncbi:hypothetical protein QQS21_007113 [Conoideocrella luteorostrata]|uniref:Magnesium chelatase n=1 Tax=Conoideocrella luteorostrata TaxID=1105319 RepID=A0AAJ0FXN6_9HYPO|nr:hypothetical protein QQS21_007113 [Conoideocrella luteorostrata]
MASTTTLLNTILTKVHNLSDVGLAVLLCLITHDHPILTIPSPQIDSLIHELSLIASRTFNLTHAIVNCTPSTTLDDFASSILITPPPSRSKSPGSLSRPDYFVHSPRQSSRLSTSAPPSGRIANCILVKNLNLASRTVQTQALELIRTRRIFTRTSVQTAPKQFIFIPVLEADSPGGGPRLTPHLNDFFSLAHWHDPDDGFVNIEEEEEDVERGSMESVVRREDAFPKTALISESDISHLALISQQVEIDIDVIRYQMNIVSFLRMHRAVQDGITPAATKDFEKLMRSLATIHELNYVTPALVGVAAKKVYLHRIRITTPENERSMQWGSNLEAVASLLKNVEPEQVVDDVLSMVTAPI